MKTRGWLVAAAFMAASVIAPDYAMATDVGDIIDVPKFTTSYREALRNDTKTQVAVGENVADRQGFTGDAKQNVTDRVVRSSSRGDLLGRLNAAANAVMPTTYSTFDIMPLGGNGTPTIPGYEGTAVDVAAGIYDGTTQVSLGEWIAIDNSLNGYAGGAGVNSGLDTIEFNSSMIHRHQQDIRADMRAALNDCAPGFVSRIWASPFHNNISQKDRGLDAGYKYKMSGVTVGYDLMAGPVNFGANFTYSKGDYEWRDAPDDNKIHNYGASIYAQYYTSSGFFAAVDGGYNYGKNKWNRYLGGLDDTFNDGTDDFDLYGWERGRNHTKSYWVGGMLGYDFKTCSGFTLTPTVGLYWNHAESSAYRSTIDGDAGDYFIGYGKYKKKSLLLPVDITASYDHQISDCSKISVRANAGYTYNFKKKGATGWNDWAGIDGTEATAVEGITAGRNRWHAGAGVSYNYKNFDLGVDYRFEGAKKYKSHSVSATVGVRF